MKNMAIELVDIVEKEFSEIVYKCINGHGHLVYKWERIGKIIFQFSPKKRTFYIRDASRPTEHKFVNMGMVKSADEIRNFIRIAMYKHDKKEWYKGKETF